MPNRRNARGRLETVTAPDAPRITTELLSGPNAARVSEHGLHATRSVNRQARDDALNSLWGHKAALAEYEHQADGIRNKLRQAEEWIRREEDAIRAWENELESLEE